MSTLLLSFPQIVVCRLYILPVAVYYYKVDWKPGWGDATPTSLCICQSCSGEHNKQPNAIKDQPAKPARKYYASRQHAINLNTVKTTAKLSTQNSTWCTSPSFRRCSVHKVQYRVTGQHQSVLQQSHHWTENRLQHNAGGVLLQAVSWHQFNNLVTYSSVHSHARSI